MADTYKVTWFNVETVCYGELNETSNFHVVCENEADDAVWCDGVDAFTEANYTWDNVVLYLQRFFKSDIVEISAV